MVEKAYSEELVWIQSEDDLRLNGVVVRPTKEPAKRLAVLHVPGWDISFCHPLHLLLSRGLAAYGYTSLIGNNRGWAFGEIAQQKDGYKVIGAGWERIQECLFDIGAWANYAATLGFEAIALLGHSLGAAKIIFYQAHRQNPDVTALICASPGPTALQAIDPKVVSTAKQWVAQGRGDDLLPWGSHGGSSTLSASALLDWLPGGPFDVFGMTTQKPLIADIQTPLLMFYGTRDIGTEAELKRLRDKAISARLVDTHIVADTDHMYVSCEQDIAAMIATWLDAL